MGTHGVNAGAVMRTFIWFMIALMLLGNPNVIQFSSSEAAPPGSEEFETESWWAVSGYWENDFWVGETCEFVVKTGGNGLIELSGYYPYEITGNEILMVSIDGQNSREFVLPDNNFQLEAHCPQNSLVTLTLNSSFAFSATPPDIRTLSFILTDLSVQ